MALAIDPSKIPNWAALPRETLPPPLLRAVTARALRLGTRQDMLAPWLDGRAAIVVLRSWGLDTFAIAERMAWVCEIDHVSEAWQTFVAQPSARRLEALWTSRRDWHWTKCAVALSCLPDEDRTTAIAAMEEIRDHACREPWAVAAVWLWRDKRAEAMPVDLHWLVVDRRVFASERRVAGAVMQESARLVVGRRADCSGGAER